VILFVVLVRAGLRIAMNAHDVFGTLLAAGITSLIGLQASFMMAVTTGLLPTKGLPLPFISYGGTALMVFLGMAGILVNVGAQAHEPEPANRYRSRTASQPRQKAAVSA
jgi:cell division protein FtsW